MNTFNKRSLCVAIAATGLLGAGGVAQAVNVSAQGTGNVLIYPYYTVRTTAAGNAYNTYISVVNTTATTKAVKVRFREGRNSREVLDFNVFLSPNDVWAGSVIPTTDGAAVVTRDSSCTIPNLVSGVPVAFRNLKYTGSNADGGGDSLDRTREGYVEILEMATYASGSVVATNALHDKLTGLPADCTKINDTVAASEAQGVSGGLMGTLQLINPGAGASMSVNPVALDNFYPTVPPNFSIYRDTGSPNPDMTDAGTTSAIESGTTLTVSTWTKGVDAVSAALMHNAVMNEFVLDTGTLSKTDWVVTFPTKNAYVAVGSGAALPPFQNNFGLLTGKSCDDVSLTLYDREERNPQFPGGGPDFSPRPTVSPTIPQLCYEANVVTFNGGNLLASTNSSLDVNTVLSTTATDRAQNGWMIIGFTGANAKLISANTSKVSFAAAPPTVGATAAATYAGLPVVGFNVFSYTNSALKVGSVVSNVPTNYGMGVNHKSTTSILP